MRIAMFSWESMYSVAIGGLAPHVTELAAGLQRRGHEIHVFTRMGINQSRYDLIDGVHYHRCPFEGHSDFMTYVARMNDSFVWHLAETEAHLGEPFDLVHGHDWMSTWALAQVKHRHGRPVVYTMHSTEYGRCGNCLWDDPMSRRIRDLEWEGTYIANRVICVSQTLRTETMSQYQVPGDKTHAVYNGVNVYRYDGPVDAQAVRTQHGVSMEDPLVLFAGRLTWQKGPDLLVEAIPEVVRSFPRATFVFAGDGDMRPGLESRSGLLGISGSTRFLGHRNGQTLTDLFKSSDIVCVPSRNEPFGIVILEAWSASKPVVATRIGGPSEFVQHAQNGFTVDPNTESIAHGLSLALSDLPGSREMGRRGREEAEARFTWDHSATHTEQVYAAALSAPGPHPSTNHRPGGHSTVTTGATPSGTTVRATLTADGKVPDELIRERAYAIFVGRGGTPGDPMLDWLQAERELREELSPPVSAPAEGVILKANAEPRAGVEATTARVSPKRRSVRVR